MPPRSPLPQRHGLDAAWARTPDHGVPLPATMGDWLRERFGERVEVGPMLAAGRFVYADASPVAEGDPCRPQTFVWFHRDLRDEEPVPGALHVLHRDERIVVVDKPPFLSTIPRGQHVLQSVVVRLRQELDLPELAPIHRLDRVTSGVLMLSVQRQWRGAYQSMFERREVRKTYRALAPLREDLAFPLTVRNHIVKNRGEWAATVVPDAPVNAETLIDLDRTAGEHGVYRLEPHTGRTHQLRLHLHGLGIPIVDDPLYPEVRDVSVDDFSRPLQLLAAEIAFTDPVDGTERSYTAARTLPLLPES